MQKYAKRWKSLRYYNKFKTFFNKLLYIKLVYPGPYATHVLFDVLYCMLCNYLYQVIWFLPISLAGVLTR
jgi:hypothetical protein